MKLYQHAKNKPVSLIYSGEIVDLKILQPDWLREFWPIYLEQNFSQIYDLNSANDINFHYRTTLVEMNDQTKRPNIELFPQYFEQKKFFQKIWLCHAQLDEGF